MPSKACAKPSTVTSTRRAQLHYWQGEPDLPTLPILSSGKMVGSSAFESTSVSDYCSGATDNMLFTLVTPPTLRVTSLAAIFSSLL